MKPEIEILAAYTFTIVAALIIASLIPPSVASSAPQAFAKPSSTLLYVLYIAAVGVLLAAFFKFKSRILRALKPITSYYDAHKKTTRRITFALLALAIGYLIIKVPSLLLVIAAYIGIFALGYIIIKKFIKRFSINKKFLFIIFTIAEITILGYEFTPETALIFIAALAVYDFIAVFVTKHMLVLAEHMSNPFVIYRAVDLTPKPQSAIKKETIDSAKAKMTGGKVFALASRYGSYSVAEVRIDKKLKKRVEAIWHAGAVPVLNTMGLGGGDFMAAGVVVLAMFRESPLLGALFLNGAIIGLLITFALSHRLKRPLPAIPIICIGFAISFMIAMIL